MLPKKRRMYSNNGGSLYGGSLSVLDQAQFFAPLKTTLVLSRGTGDPTFTRATTAYVKDFEDVWREVPSGAARFEGARVVRNVIQNSGVLTAAVGGWFLLNCTSVVGATDPDGGTTAYTVTATAGTATCAKFASQATPAGNRHTVSIWVKRLTGSGAVSIRNAANGAVDITASLTTSWKRFASVAVEAAYSEVDCGVSLATSGDAVAIWHPLAEDVTGQTNQNPSEYVSVGVLSAPYHGAGVDGVKYFDTENGNSVASNVVTEATGAAIPDATLKGYFAEGQRQNRCLYSQDFTNAAWVSGGGGIAVTPNTAVAPDGTTTADTLTASGANGTLIQDLGVVASAAKAGGMWLKRKTGTGNIDLTLDGGSTWTTVAVTSSWLLLEKTQTLADEDFGIRIVTSGDEVYAWQAQVETGAFISSPIPTTTAAVTRNGDALTYPLAGNSSNTVGTVYAEVTPKVAYATVSDNRILAGGGSGAIICQNNNAFGSYDGTSPITSTNAITGETTGKGAVKWESSSRSVCCNGGTVVSGGYDGSFGMTTVGIADGSNQYMRVKNVRIWNKALTDATLQSITT